MLHIFRQMAVAFSALVLSSTTLITISAQATTLKSNASTDLTKSLSIDRSLEVVSLDNSSVEKIGYDLLQDNQLVIDFFSEAAGQEKTQKLGETEEAIKPIEGDYYNSVQKELEQQAIQEKLTMDKSMYYFFIGLFSNFGLQESGIEMLDDTSEELLRQNKPILTFIIICLSFMAMKRVIFYSRYKP